MSNIDESKIARRYESDSGESDSDEEAASFKRSKRAKAMENQSGRKVITFSNGNNTNGSSTNGIPRSTTNKTPQAGLGISSRSRYVDLDAVDNSEIIETKIDFSRKRIPENPDNGHTLLDPSPSSIMAQMGFEKGKGFAKFIKPVSLASNAFSVSKFDKKLKDLGLDNVEVSPEIEDFSVEEDVSWIPPEVPQSIDFGVFKTWLKVGPMPTSIEGEVTFVDPSILKEVFACKKIFHEMDESLYQSIRARANVFERIGKGPFICRAAMKMANLDSVLGFSLTEPKTQSGNTVVGHNDLFYFADVCAGPGGFTEYILWRKKWEAKGFGLTLKGNLDFKTNDFEAAEPESFEAYYGPADDGNIYKPENVSGYIKYVLGFTNNKGVHLMMADGGFSVSKQENMQEVLSGQIILSQCLVAVAVVRTGGHFVCKLFDIFTPFSIGLIYLMYLSFDLVSIHKPNTSRPANSERYLICKWKREGTDVIMKYLLSCHYRMWLLSKTEDAQKQTILELVPVTVLTRTNHPFFKYILESNNLIGKMQIQSLKKMIPYVRDPTLENMKQSEARMKSLELWGVPEEIPLPPNISTDDLYSHILGAYPKTMAKHAEKDLSFDTMESYFRSPYDWRFVVVEAIKEQKNRGFYISMGRNMVYRYDGYMWILADLEEKLELTSKTMVYGEIVSEIHGKKPTQVVTNAFHIIDGVMLGGKDIRMLHYTQRHEYCVKFAKAMCKNVQGVLPVRVKNPVRMENIADVIDRLEHRVIKGTGIGAKLVCPIDHTDETCPVIQPAGLLFIKITRDPWQMALNRTANRKYWFHKATGQTRNDVPESAIADFFWTMMNRVTWWWDRDTNVTLSSMDATDPRISQLNPKKVHAFSLTNHVNIALRTPPRINSPEKTGPSRRESE